ncbi:aminotransferase class IV [Anaeromyxobacter dehalogenans 2CP-1]|uniref:Aminotransferase class IV n=1 Tax=Anaeromyxobacter dehalogenans (strain ATCC BAA-258 / DSM 21875 / 2CP-1) TaxID=455488 RepID=B8J9G2_ANAD2|nr:aminotransferase class IV family protein [Anaeromyxobacter dehalogenans]ACL67350.1 aminotransferase class IV [Anaeromyxobacter dehalogenans 2CP-1]
MSGLLLLEALRWEPAGGWFLLDRHLARLAGAAARFGHPFDPAAVRAALEGAVAGLEGSRKVRLELAADGRLAVEALPLPSSRPLGAALAPDPVDSADAFLRFKTSRREPFERARACHPESDEVILWNERGELTETSTGNLVLERGGRRLTPPASAGLLPGTFRAHLLEAGELEEAALTLGDLSRAERIWQVSSVRGWVELKLEPRGR